VSFDERSQFGEVMQRKFGAAEYDDLADIVAEYKAQKKHSAYNKRNSPKNHVINDNYI